MAEFDKWLEVVRAQCETLMCEEGRGQSATAPASLQPCSGGSLLPTLDQDSLECEARISIWGIGRNV